MAALTALLTALGGALGGRQSALMFLAFAAIFNVGAFWFSDRVVLRMYKAQVVGPEEAPDLYARVDALRKRADLPMPTVAIAPSQQPNALRDRSFPRERGGVLYRGPPPGHGPGRTGRRDRARARPHQAPPHAGQHRRRHGRGCHRGHRTLGLLLQPGREPEPRS